MKLIYRIGDIVKKNAHTSIDNIFVILAAKGQNLDIEFLKQNPIKIYNIEVLAKKIPSTLSGFDYLIAKIKSQTDELIQLDNESPFESVFQDDICQ